MAHVHEWNLVILLAEYPIVKLKVFFLNGGKHIRKGKFIFIKDNISGNVYFLRHRIITLMIVVDIRIA